MCYQKLRGAEEIQSEWLDPGVVDAKLSVDAGALYAGQDAQIGGKPCWIWDAQVRNNTGDDDGLGTEMFTLPYLYFTLFCLCT